ncbi:hypothetical protein I3843_08G077700 [Carya illinoinensis]|uniref:Phorbol-ester/DAG-type domain-containing protein n=1 Tax=Carya illinoinensis TaxID=32201 RepID=A0A8T1PRF4_CARIL|nr:diacylglycerol kinase theta [Carya illinoinensis]KAG2693053.1 hypothetical protein I3760_08G080700 [Carya illinoinensis]KAG6644808.1 hypothetical protein CIPAW_08G078600 [Carya illinoinensis]KAG6699742.1 hypothetical protein I3842_08G079900 [Carya illinoinensis]KAG7967008.1 hypothetical protein I3843_08G077700 [Carya illinoinensis]
MELPKNPRPTTFVPENYPLIEFATSPQLILGEEMLHFNHPQHPLSKLDLPDPFTCSGCKEYGAGMRFTCRQCDFQLHEFCAHASPDLKGHPFHYLHPLTFYSKPGKDGKSKCDVCFKPAKGYAFRCGACGFQMHPCCARLSSETSFLCHPAHTLRLVPANMTGVSGDSGFLCGLCKRKRSGRVFHCTVCDYHLHAVCAKSMVNGLYAYGIKDLEKPSMLGSAARVVSKVVIVLLEGLVEGIAEGFGEVLGEDLARGRGRNGSS